jgi:hypothetical protein
MLASLCNTHLIGALPVPLSLASTQPPTVSRGSGSRAHPAGGAAESGTAGHATQPDTSAIDIDDVPQSTAPPGLPGLQGTADVDVDVGLGGVGQGAATGSGLAIGNMDMGSGASAPPEPVLPAMSDLSRWAEERAALEFSRREGVRLGSRAVLDVLKGSGSGR